jgi:two-component system chemotaxis sensor kinase CheA
MKKDAARDALVQEARELLVAMEAALLQIEAEGPSKDAINAIFRAAHTIKGSAGLFAFDSIVAFTHILESVLERVRKNELPLDEALMSLLLQCGDYIGALVDAIEQLHEDTDPDPQQRAELEAALQRLLSEEPEQATAKDNLDLLAPASSPLLPTSTPTISSAPSPAHAAAADPDGAVTGNPFWHLSLRFSQDVLRHGLDPVSFLHYLRTLGRMAAVLVIDQEIPAAAQMDAENCYLGFEIAFASDSTQETLENVFEFVRDDSSIQVLPPRSAPALYAAQLAQLSAVDAARLGVLFDHIGAFDAFEWNAILELAQHDRASLPVAADLPDIAALDVHALSSTAATATIQAAVAAVNALAVAPMKPRSLEDKRAQEQKFIKIEVSKLDQLINLVGELVIAGAGASLIAKRRKDPQFEEATQSIGGLVEQIRDAALTLRMVQVNEIFQRFPRVVRDLARDLGKDIELVMTGSETELDKSMVEKIADPLMHIVRNAIDHGIEPAHERVAAGKPEASILRLNATHESGSVVIEVMDDGRGMNRDRILRKAVEQGVVSADAELSEADIFRLVFEPGFSTAEQVTALSGRGVGMDVVKKNVDALRGDVDIATVLGQGTVVRIRLPLTMAIISGFQVIVGNAVFVIPLDMVVECINLVSQNIDNNIVTLRDEPLPFIPLGELFELPARASGRKSLVVVQYGHHRAGLMVDGLLGECQAVIKPLGKLFSKVKGLSGSTILGDGRVALILDVPHLIQYTQQQEQVRLIQPERGFASEQ